MTKLGFSSVCWLTTFTTSYSCSRWMVLTLPVLCILYYHWPPFPAFLLLLLGPRSKFFHGTGYVLLLDLPFPLFHSNFFPTTSSHVSYHPYFEHVLSILVTYLGSASIYLYYAVDTSTYFKFILPNPSKSK